MNRANRNGKAGDLEGDAGSDCQVALLLIDVINRMSFEGSESLVRRALPMADALAALKRKAQESGIPTIYVNDNFGRWRSDFRATVKYCLRPDSPGRKIAARLKPGPRDYFVLKPKHSGFHATPLGLLLRHLGVRTLVLGGVAANICVLFTANDAYMRDYEIHVPSDCVASNTDGDTREALRQMRRFLKADTRRSSHIDFGALKLRRPPPHER
jgi:nicotinamidase-related amidase